MTIAPTKADISETIIKVKTHPSSRVVSETKRNMFSVKYYALELVLLLSVIFVYICLLYLLMNNCDARHWLNSR